MASHGNDISFKLCTNLSVLRGFFKKLTANEIVESMSDADGASEVNAREFVILV